MIGYLIGQALQNTLPGRQVGTVLTQILVSLADPAFADPTRFIGPVYSQDEARQLAEHHGWTVRPDGPSWRRVAPSPRPQRIGETRLIRQLVDSGTIVVCAAGGCVPTVRDERIGYYPANCVGTAW